MRVDNMDVNKKLYQFFVREMILWTLLLRDMTPCPPVYTHRRFRVTCFLHLHWW